MEDQPRIVIAAESGLSIRSFDDISEAIGLGFGSSGILFTQDDLGEAFFELRTGLAGELFQKLTNYQMRAAIVLTDFGAYGQRFSELAYEHSSHPMIRLVRSMDEAKAWLES